jgi:exodeoxyribonuclease VII large subunit
MPDPETNPPSGLFAERVVLTVTALTDRIKRSLESNFRDLEVQGEVSNFKQHQSSGHWYFTLKDRNSQIRAVFYQQFNRLLRFELENGLEIRIRGRLSLYPARGEYQLIVDTAVPVRTGALQLAFDQLRRKLEAEGLFAESRKKPMPFLPNRVGVITSVDGAVSRDILNILSRRNPGLPIIIFPVHVQGNSAAGEVAEAIRFFNDRAARVGREVDVIIIARGGGSIEDLWAFNEERVARAIVASRIPVISAIGHETDFTIADFVADLRAPTPSAAAELVAPAADELRTRVEARTASLSRLLHSTLVRDRARLNFAMSSHGFTRTEARLRALSSHWSDLESRARRAFEKEFDAIKSRLADSARRLDAIDLGRNLSVSAEKVNLAEQALQRSMQRKLAEGRNELALRSGKLDMLSPLKVLGRGYLLAQRPSGHLVTQVRELSAGDRLRLRFADGEAGCEITEIQNEGA